MIVYQAFNPISRRFYIGKTKGSLHSRRKRHAIDAAQKRSPSSVFHRAIRKYGIGCFEWCVLSWCDSETDMNALEKRWISLLKTAGHSVYNMRPGGDGGSYGGKMSPCYGKAVSTETKKKISARLKRHYSSAPGTMTGRRGDACPFFGRKHSEETKKQISRTKKGVPRPDMMGAKNLSSRSVICLDTHEVFQTASEAAAKYDLDLSSLIRVCKGRAKTTKGFRFAYAEPGVFGWAVVP